MKTESMRIALLQRVKKLRELHPEVPRGFVGVGEGDDVKPVNFKDDGKTKK